MLGIVNILGVLLLVACPRVQSQSTCLTTYTYDVTNGNQVVDSQPDFDNQDSLYGRNNRRCILISTNTTDHVIKLEQVYFQLEASVQCNLDYLTVYDSSGFLHELGRYCHSNGPETLYSSGGALFLFFRSDTTLEYRGFRLHASSIHKDDVPVAFSATSIAALVICVAIVIIIISIFIFCVIKGAKKNANRVQVMPQVDRDSPYILGPYHRSNASNNTRVPRNYVLPKPPSYQESIRNNNSMANDATNSHSGDATRNGQTPMNIVPSSSHQTGAQTLPARQQIYSYQSSNTPEDIRYPMSPPPAYQP